MNSERRWTDKIFVPILFLYFFRNPAMDGQISMLPLSSPRLRQCYKLLSTEITTNCYPFHIIMILLIIVIMFYYAMTSWKGVTGYTKKKVLATSILPFIDADLFHFSLQTAIHSITCEANYMILMVDYD